MPKTLVGAGFPRPLPRGPTDDATGWTTSAAGWTTSATPANNTRRAHALDLGVTFYTLHIRVELDDDTGANKNFAIEAVYAIYSIDD